MPAASWRIIPARSIKRCDTISASFGFSLRIGRKKRDSRMGTPGESIRFGKRAVKPDRVLKYKGGQVKVSQTNGFPAFAERFEPTIEAQRAVRQAWGPDHPCRPRAGKDRLPTSGKGPFRPSDLLTFSCRNDPAFSSFPFGLPTHPISPGLASQRPAPRERAKLSLLSQIPG
jgi:hypothetical protein